jgi:ribosome-associated heat shock protein Hsp15
MSGAQEQSGAQRIDKWLWHARFARTRGAAQRLALSGHVRVNRDKVEAASRLVRPGDVLTLALGRGVQVIRICAISERRGSFEDAQRLYAPIQADGPALPEGGLPPER